MGHKKEIIDLVERFQCPGCVVGSDRTCFESNGFSKSCSRHVVGTTVPSIGKVFLGVPTGFDRLGESNSMKIGIFDDISEFSYNEFNIPVWKTFIENCTIVKGIHPRLNFPFLHIFNGDFISGIDCFEVSEELREEMD